MTDEPLTIKAEFLVPGDVLAETGDTVTKVTGRADLVKVECGEEFVFLKRGSKVLLRHVATD